MLHLFHALKNTRWCTFIDLLCKIIFQMDIYSIYDMPGETFQNIDVVFNNNSFRQNLLTSKPVTAKECSDFFNKKIPMKGQ